MESLPDSRPPLSGPEIEYMSLREEMLRRVEGRQQVLSITVTLAAAFLGIGWGTGGAVALMLFPPLAALLATNWAQNEIRARDISAYIRDHIESSVPGLGWEKYSRDLAMRSRLGNWPLDILSVGGIFAMTQILAIVLSIFRFGGTFPEYLLLFVDVFAVLALLVIVNYVRQRNAG